MIARLSLPTALLLLPALSQGEATPTYTSAEYETVITASRTERSLDDTPVETLLISRGEIEASGARDLAELLETVPGVQIVRDGRFGAGVQIQGLSSRHVLVLVDGHRLSGASGGIQDLSRLPLENIAQVEIVKGASSALYGADAMGGVIHLRTRSAARPLEGQAEVRAGDQGWKLGASAAASNQRSVLRLSGGFRHEEAYRLDPGSVPTTGSGLDDLHLELRGEHQFSGTFGLTGTASYLDRSLEAVDAGIGRAVFDRSNRTEVASASLASTLDFADEASLRLSLHTSFTHDRMLQDQRGSDALNQFQRTRNWLWQAGAQWDQTLGSHRLTAGAEFFYDTLESDRLASGRGERLRPAVYAQDDWKVVGTLALTPGLRLDHDSWFTSHLSPKIAARMQPLSWLTLRANYGLGFRAPDFQEMLTVFENPSIGYRLEGNPDLRPETSRGGALGFSARATRWLTIDASYFRHELQDLIASTVITPAGPQTPSLFGYTNIAAATSQGVETALHLRPLARLRIDLAYTFNPTWDETEERPLSDRPRHRATLAASWRSGVGTTLMARGEWVGERELFLLEGDKRIVAEPYTFLTLQASQEIGAGFSFLAGVANALNEGNLETLPIRPRNFWAGVSARF